MRIVKSLRNGLRSLTGRRRQESELEAELSLHFEQLVRQYRAEGMSEREAELAARREFGNVGGVYEEARRAWRWTWLEDLAKDLRFGARMLRKSPGFTVTAVASLALGIGANTAIFSLVKQVILDSLPVREPGRLVNLRRSTLENPSVHAFPRPFLKDLQEADDLPFDGFLAATGLRGTLVADEGAESVAVQLVSGSYYDVLGVRPAIGRLLSEEDDEGIGGHPVAVLSHAFWERRFGRDASILNRAVRLNGDVFTIVGVAAAGFGGLNPGSTFDIQIPIAMAPFPATQLASRRDWWLDVYGRLKPGVSAEQAGNALTPLLLRNFETLGTAPQTDYQRRIRESERMIAVPARRGGGPPQQWEQALHVLAAIVGAVLLLACVNIAHLLLARASARQREHSVRAAIGAGRGRLIRQQLTESVLLGSLGGLLGIGVAYALTRTLVTMMVSDLERSTLEMSPSQPVLAFNFAMALLVGVLFGLAPALRASRASLLGGLKGAAENRIGRMASGKILIAVQIAVSVVLLMGAALFARTLGSYHSMDLGFRPERVVWFGFNPAGFSQEQAKSFYARAGEAIAAVPGVEAVATGRMTLLGGGQWSSGIAIDGREVSEQEQRQVLRDTVSPGYFSLLGMPLLAGREFTAADTAEAPKVAVVNESFARHFFGDRDPIGRRIGEHEQAPDITVVGVVRDSKYAQLRETPRQFWWVPNTQFNWDRTGNGMMVYVRTAAEPDGIIRAVRRLVGDVDSRVALFNVRTMEMQFDSNLRIERLLALLSLFFGGLAALLAAVGLFGVLAYSVARREREIGIRIALGASRWEASWEVLRGVAVYVFAGLALGLAGSAAAGRLVEGFLFGVTSRDLISLTAACTAMAVIAAAATFIPARRAASVPPAVAFRAE